jgi:hypothetical protein
VLFQTSGSVEEARPATWFFNLNAIDFLARRKVVFGMTCAGRSNTMKQLVSVIMSKTSGSTG